jgi:hypothetical protein
MSLHEDNDKKINEIYNEGFKEGYNESNKDFRKREYHAGYKQGYRDACEDRYWYGWYSGLMVGTLATIGGILMYTTSKKSRLTPF